MRKRDFDTDATFTGRHVTVGGVKYPYRISKTVTEDGLAGMVTAAAAERAARRMLEAGTLQPGGAVIVTTEDVGG